LSSSETLKALMIKGVSARSQRVETTTGSEINGEGEGRSWLVNEAWRGGGVVRGDGPAGKLWETQSRPPRLDKSRQRASQGSQIDAERAPCT
jgi:hypothetical protein